MKQGYDLIGDVHGQLDKLVSLLHKLGYVHSKGVWRHPQGRKVIFLGDYIDRGPQVREVLHLVRGMCETGDALAIMGNHEYNAICYHTPNGKGGWLREHSESKSGQIAATLEAFAGREDEWADWLDWMKRLPLFLDLGDFRCVHACWDAKRIPRLAGRQLTDDAFLLACATPCTPEHRAIENILKGPEVAASDGNLFRDKDGTYRNTIRAKWWRVETGATIAELAMPPGSSDDRMTVEHYLLRRLPNYNADSPPVFFGHYWLPSDAPKRPLASNIACLDFSAGREGSLVAYRWNGEPELSEKHFVVHAPFPDP